MKIGDQVKYNGPGTWTTISLGTEFKKVNPEKDKPYKITYLENWHGGIWIRLEGCDGLYEVHDDNFKISE